MEPEARSGRAQVLASQKWLPASLRRRRPRAGPRLCDSRQSISVVAAAAADDDDISADCFKMLQPPLGAREPESTSRNLTSKVAAAKFWPKIPTLYFSHSKSRPPFSEPLEASTRSRLTGWIRVGPKQILLIQRLEARPLLLRSIHKCGWPAGGVGDTCGDRPRNN